jgi:ribonuclease P protein component
MQKYNLTYEERLRSKRLIGALFGPPGGGATSYVAHPLRVVWVPVPVSDEATEVPPPAQVAISVSKRTFKKATQRNRVKRLIREAYRLHKPDWYAHLAAANTPPIAIMLMFIGKEEPTYEEVVAGIRKMIRKF